MRLSKHFGLSLRSLRSRAHLSVSGGFEIGFFNLLLSVSTQRERVWNVYSRQWFKFVSTVETLDLRSASAASTQGAGPVTVPSDYVRTSIEDYRNETRKFQGKYSILCQDTLKDTSERRNEYLRRRRVRKRPLAGAQLAALD